MIQVLPSLISAPLLELKTIIKQLEPLSFGFHIDVMDFHFVPNLTWGPPFINTIAQATPKLLHVHLMVDNPQSYFTMMALRPGDIVSVHYELGYEQALASLILIKKNGWVPSLAINPSTPITVVKEFIPYIDHCLLMSVNPGFSGQLFIEESKKRLAELVELRKEHKASFTICLDGGITQENSKILHQLGMDQAAVASAIFSSSNPEYALQKLTRAS